MLGTSGCGRSETHHEKVEAGEGDEITKLVKKKEKKKMEMK